MPLSLSLGFPVLLRWLLGAATRGPYYVRINRERIAVRNVSSGESFECHALLGIDNSNRVVSVGYPVSQDAVRKVNPFDHPRVLVDDFLVAEKIFAHAIRELSGMTLFRPAPVVLVHPDIDLEGGLTSIEARVLRELAEGAGARKTFIHYGPVLNDDDVKRIASEA